MPHDASPPRVRLGMVVVIAGTAMVVLGAFLPWIVSGEAARSSFATVRSADRLGLVDGGVGLALLRSWYLMPLAAALVPVLVLLHRPRLAALVGLALAALTGAIGAAVLVLAPETGIGPWVSLAGGVAVVVGSCLVLRGRRERVRTTAVLR